MLLTLSMPVLPVLPVLSAHRVQVELGQRLGKNWSDRQIGDWSDCHGLPFVDLEDLSIAGNLVTLTIL